MAETQQALRVYRGWMPRARDVVRGRNGIVRRGVRNWALGVQHQFPANFVASIEGAGSRIQHLVLWPRE
jgi:hypothetical protein